MTHGTWMNGSFRAMCHVVREERKVGGGGGGGGEGEGKLPHL